MLATTTSASRPARPAVFRSAAATSPSGEYVRLPLDLELRRHLDRAVGKPCAREVAAEVVADWRQAVAAKPDVGLDRAAGRRRDREGAEGDRRALRLRAERFAEHELDASLLELTANLVPELLLVGSREDLGLGLEDRDPLLGPAVADLAGELEPGRPGADDQHSLRLRQLLVALPVAADSRSCVVGSRLGRVGVGRAGGEDDEVGRELGSGGERDAAARRPRRPGRAATRPLSEQAIVGQRRSSATTQARPAPAALRRCGRRHRAARPGSRRRTRRAPWRQL